jgi:hypothetical protein
LVLSVWSAALYASTNVIIFDGTSMTKGSGAPAGRSYPEQLGETLGSSWQITNLGVRGQTGAQMLSDFSAQVAPLFNPANHQAIVYEMGVNDLTAGEMTETVKQRIDAYFAACVAAGMPPSRIFILPIGPSYFAGNFKSATRAEINQYLLAQYPRNAIDPEWEPRLFATGANLNTNFFADLTHPNEVGCALQAAVVKRKMQEEGFLPSELSVAIYAGVTIKGEVGRTYRIESAASPDTSTWNETGQITLTSTSQVWFDLQSPRQARQFYRAVSLP